MKAFEDIACSGGKVNIRLAEFRYEDITFRKFVEVEGLEELTGYWVGWEKVGKRNFVKRTVMDRVLFDAWTGCVVTTLNTEVKWSGQRQTLFPTVYGSYRRRAVSGILTVPWEAVKNVPAPEFSSEGMMNEEETTVCKSSEKIVPVARSTTRRLGAVLDRYVACCQRDERMAEILQ